MAIFAPEADPESADLIEMYCYSHQLMGAFVNELGGNQYPTAKDLDELDPNFRFNAGAALRDHNNSKINKRPGRRPSSPWS